MAALEMLSAKLPVADGGTEWSRVSEGKWMRRLIPELREWIDKEHGEINYFLAQFITGHGCFTHYLNQFEIRETDGCWYCRRRDDAEHTFFECDKWREQRMRVEKELERAITPDNVIRIMLDNDKNWGLVEGWIVGVIKRKERDERAG
ncbi:uncharacterized protein [Euwallacea similis]|uniref:uncharacterized protein n=1 Tax=Euwallacea similis TaxID=1736056 RepID=UPI003450B326